MNKGTSVAHPLAHSFCAAPSCQSIKSEPCREPLRPPESGRESASVFVRSFSFADEHGDDDGPDRRRLFTLLLQLPNRRKAPHAAGELAKKASSSRRAATEREREGVQEDISSRSVRVARRVAHHAQRGGALGASRGCNGACQGASARPVE